MNIIIRPANSNDFPSILSLIREFSVFQKTPEKVTITLEQMNEEKEFFRCLIAETEAKQIVGFASFFFAYYSWTGKAIYLDDLYVTEQYRKNKIGLQLLNTILDFAKKEGCKKVKWQVSDWNKNAIEFYRKMGAEIDETECICNLYLKPGI